MCPIVSHLPKIKGLETVSNPLFSLVGRLRVVQLAPFKVGWLELADITFRYLSIQGKVALRSSTLQKMLQCRPKAFYLIH